MFCNGSQVVVNDEKGTPPDDSPLDTSENPVRSPIRPSRPESSGTQPQPPSTPQSGLIAKGEQLAAKASGESPQSPQLALETLRRKMEGVATEFGQGKINRAQFNAIYGRYSEQRTIIEKLLARDPKSQSWKQAAAPGHTTFLRGHFEARLLYYLVYQHEVMTPLLVGGGQQPSIDEASLVLKQLWSIKNRPKVGLARKNMNNGQWMVLALGEFAVTLALFQLEPSTTQANLVRDLHNDFERANQRMLERGTQSLDHFVFPQRALAEK
jgi:hypothetical protein